MPQKILPWLHGYSTSPTSPQNEFRGGSRKIQCQKFGATNLVQFESNKNVHLKSPKKTMKRNF